MAGLNTDTNLSLATIATAGGKTAPYSLGGLRGKAIYNNARDAIIDTVGPISMSVFKFSLFEPAITAVSIRLLNITPRGASSCTLNITPTFTPDMTGDYLQKYILCRVFEQTNKTPFGQQFSFIPSQQANGYNILLIPPGTYSIRVTAQNAATPVAVDSGYQSIILSIPPILYAPTQPAISDTVSYLNGSTRITWTAPASDGGSAITSYSWSVNSNGTGLTSVGLATSLDVSGSKTVYVYATNAIGTSPASIGLAVSVYTVVGAPTLSTTLIYGDGYTTISWTAPASDGGSPITSYYWQVSDIWNTSLARFAGNGSARSTNINANVFISGTIYLFALNGVQIPSTNILGAGLPSAGLAVTVYTAPGTPTSVGAWAGFNQIYVNWGAASGTVTRYQLNWTGAAAPITSASSPYIITGLSAGSYTVTVTAYNGPVAGTSASPPAVTVGAYFYTSGAGTLTFPLDSVVKVIATAIGGGGGGGNNGLYGGSVGGGGSYINATFTLIGTSIYYNAGAGAGARTDGNNSWVEYSNNTLTNKITAGGGKRGRGFGPGYTDSPGGTASFIGTNLTNITSASGNSSDAGGHVGNPSGQPSGYTGSGGGSGIGDNVTMTGRPGSLYGGGGGGAMFFPGAGAAGYVSIQVYFQ